MLQLVSYQLRSQLRSSNIQVPIHVGIFLPKVKAAISSNEGHIVSLLDIPGISELFSDRTVGSFSMNQLIEKHDQYIPPLVSFVQSSSSDSHRTLLPRSEVKLLSPIPVPRRNVICVGKNYTDHIAEVAKADKTHGIGTTTAPTTELPKYPQFFTKAPDSVIGPEEQIESHHQITKWLDYEAELAVVIGKKGRDLTPQNAHEHIFGYTIANDVTARDIQRHHGQWFKGKTLDATCPLGPWIVYKDPSSSLNAQNLGISLWVNDEKRQSSNTANMIFNITDILCHLSKGFTLQPGDVILTGTPDGVGYAMKPPKVLNRGDKVKIEIEKIGTLENIVN